MIKMGKKKQPMAQDCISNKYSVDFAASFIV